MSQSFPGKWRLGKIRLTEAAGQGFPELGTKIHCVHLLQKPGPSSTCYTVLKVSDGHSPGQILGMEFSLCHIYQLSYF